MSQQPVKRSIQSVTRSGEIRNQAGSSDHLTSNIMLIVGDMDMISLLGRHSLRLSSRTVKHGSWGAALMSSLLTV